MGRRSSITAHTLITVAAESGEGDPPTGPPILLLRDVSPSSRAPAVQLRFPVCHWSSTRAAEAASTTGYQVRGQ